jgi:hypothetical protein
MEEGVTFFSKDIWSCIFRHLPIDICKSWAFISPMLHYASRIGSTGRMRWKIPDTKTLNVLSKKFFVHLIQAVKTADLTIISCLHYMKIKLIDIEFIVSNRMNFKLSRDDFICFDQLLYLKFYFNAVGSFHLVNMPVHLKSLSFTGKGENTRIRLSSSFPATLEKLVIKLCKISAGIILPEGLKVLKYVDSDCFKNIPKNIPIGIVKLHFVGNDVAEWKIFDTDMIYPNLTSLVLVLKDFDRNKNVCVRTGQFPGLKYAEGSRLRIVNNVGLYVRDMHSVKDMDQVYVCKIGEEEEKEKEKWIDEDSERMNKKIKR